jgi:segregation and condensation protein B
MSEPEMIEDDVMEKIAQEMQDEAIEEEVAETEQAQEEDKVEESVDTSGNAPETLAEPLEESELLRMLEAILFASAEPISPQAMLERLPEGADLNVLLPQIKSNYEGRGVELIEVGGQWAFRTAQDVADALTIQKEVSKKLSKAALETLSIVAYHQPITRAEIENIRGVATHKGTLDILMELGWVKPGRRRETPGRPLTWVTTNGFLDHFQLESVVDLPGLDELKASGLLDRRAAIDTLPESDDLFDNADVDAEEELDKETVERQDEDAYDEQSYKEMQSRAKDNTSEEAEDLN